jgi:hypothetical protein
MLFRLCSKESLVSCFAAAAVERNERKLRIALMTIPFYQCFGSRSVWSRIPISFEPGSGSAFGIRILNQMLYKLVWEAKICND